MENDCSDSDMHLTFSQNYLKTRSLSSSQVSPVICNLLWHQHSENEFCKSGDGLRGCVEEAGSLVDKGVDVLNDFRAANLSSSAAASVRREDGDELRFPNEAVESSGRIRDHTKKNRH